MSTEPTVEQGSSSDLDSAYLEAMEESGEPVPDPHYLELLRSSRLPQAYLPATMAGPQKAWIRIASMLVIGIFVLATALGICLTYGPGA
jgi:hypothetical protein